MYVMRCEGNPRPRTGRTQAGDGAMIKLALCDPYSLCPSLGYCFFLKLLVFHFLSPDPAGQVTSSFVFLVKHSFSLDGCFRDYWLAIHFNCRPDLRIFIPSHIADDSSPLISYSPECAWTDSPSDDDSSASVCLYLIKS